MSEITRATSLQLEQDAAAQHREWRFERAGWLLLAVILAAALAGAFGDGPLARAHATAPEGASVDYDRVIHYGGASALSLLLPPASAGDTVSVVTLDRALLDRADVERVTPDPLETRASAATIEYHLRRSNATAPLRADFSLKATAIGWRTVHLGTPAGTLVARQFVLP